MHSCRVSKATAGRSRGKEEAQLQMQHYDHSSSISSSNRKVLSTTTNAIRSNGNDNSHFKTTNSTYAVPKLAAWDVYNKQACTKCDSSSRKLSCTSAVKNTTLKEQRQQ